MKSIVLDGKSLAKKLEIEVAKKVEEWYKKTGKKPKLATIIVGNFAPSIVYVNMKKAACERVGMACEIFKFNENITEGELISHIKRLNGDEGVHGILIQHPLPKHINEQVCLDSVVAEKDVDGLSSLSFGKMCNKESAFVAATARGIMKLLVEYNISLEGKHAVVVGRSAILGKPIAMQLMHANATVTITHSKTKDLKHHLENADIVVAALGKPKYIQAHWCKKGAVLIDAGYNSGNVGDINTDKIDEIASAYTPVPGGVGPMTISALLTQTLESFEKSIKM